MPDSIHDPRCRKFPLTAHPASVWAKKIRGKLYYFGPWSDPDGALANYRRQEDDLQAGRVPGPDPRGRVVLADLCNHFLDSKVTRVEIGTMTQRLFLDCKRACERLVSILGWTVIGETMRPEDFTRLASELAKGVGIVTLANRIRLSRAVFRFAYTSGKIPSPLRFGENLQIPEKATLRAERNRKWAIDFNWDELGKILGAAGIPLRAMILLGLNCGFGNTDCASLSVSAVDLDAGWIDFPRPKTAVPRRAALWPETVEALHAVLGKPASGPIPQWRAWYSSQNMVNRIPGCPKLDTMSMPSRRNSERCSSL